MALPEGVEIKPRVTLGKPMVRGTRIPVELILRKLGGGHDGAGPARRLPQSEGSGYSRCNGLRGRGARPRRDCVVHRDVANLADLVKFRKAREFRTKLTAAPKTRPS